jgi:peptidoglycan/LPS O-acetylase OafA/YrhL
MLGHPSTSALLIMGSFLLFPAGFVSGIPSAEAYPYNNPVCHCSSNLSLTSSTAAGSAGAGYGVVIVCAIGLGLTSVLLKPCSFLLIGFQSPGLFAAGALRVCCSFWLGVALFRIGLADKMRPLPLGLASVVLLLSLLTPASGSLYSLAAVLLIFPVLVAGSATASVSPLKARVCRVSGELSYPLYLLHQPVFRIVKDLPGLLHMAIAPEVLLVAGTVASIILAFAALYFIDIPVRGYLTNLTLTIGRTERSAEHQVLA